MSGFNYVFWFCILTETVPVTTRLNFSNRVLSHTGPHLWRINSAPLATTICFRLL